MKMRNIFHSQKDEKNSDMKKVLERLDDQTDELEKLEMAINEIGYKISIKPEKQETQKKTAIKKILKSPKKEDSFQLSNPSVENSGNKDLFWIEDIKKELQVIQREVNSGRLKLPGALLPETEEEIMMKIKTVETKMETSQQNKE